MYTTAGSMPTTFEISGLHLGIGQKFGTSAAERNPAGLHHITAMGEPQRVMGILFDEEHRRLLPFVHLANYIENLFDD